MGSLQTNATDLELADVCAVEQLKAMIDDLGEGEVYAVTRYVLFLRSVDDLFSRSLDEAPLDDEEYILDDDDNCDACYEDLSDKESFTIDEARRELGL
jgi:hypothetical protein